MKISLPYMLFFDVAWDAATETHKQWSEIAEKYGFTVDEPSVYDIGVIENIRSVFVTRDRKET